MSLSWLRIRAVARRHYYVLLRAPHRLFDVTIWPLVDVLLFGSIAAFVNPGNAPAGRLAAGYLLSGILLWHVVYQSQIALATGFLEEAWTRNLLNLMVTPLREVEYVLGVVLFGMVKLFMGLAVVSLTALAFFAFNVTDLGIGLIPVAAVLLVVGWVIALFVIALVLRFGTGAEALAWGILFVVLSDRRAAVAAAPARRSAAVDARLHRRARPVRRPRPAVGRARHRPAQLRDLGRHRPGLPGPHAVELPRARLHQPLHLAAQQPRHQ